MLKYNDDDSEYGNCDLVPPDCSVDMIKSVCPATCRKMLQNSCKYSNYSVLFIY